MSYKQMKWLILIIPTLTIGIWEYVRHEFPCLIYRWILAICWRL